MHFNFKQLYFKFKSTIQLSYAIQLSHAKQLYSDLYQNLSRLSIKIKLTIALLGCAIFTPTALIVYTIVIEENSQLEQQRKNILHHLETKAHVINGLLNSTAHEVVFLSQVPSVKIFSSVNFTEKKKSLETRMLDQFSKISSTEVFADFIRTNQLYQQLTFLDINGIERLRIDQQQENIISANDSQLVDQSTQNYFNDTMLLSEAKVYISDIELYYLHKSGDNVINPVIRLATQVFDKSGQLQGLLVANVSGKILLNIVQDTESKNALNFLIDSEGYYLAHPDENKSWSKLKGNQYTLQGDFPDFNKLLEQLPKNNIQHTVMQDNEVFFSAISTDFNQIKKWYLVEIIPSNLFFDSTQFYLFIVLFISAFGILLSLLVGYTFAKFWLLSPIKELAAMTEKISKGEFTSLSMKNRQKDEIGELCLSFNQMSSTLAEVEQERKKHVNNLNNEISERKKLESDLLLHRTFFEQSTDAMFIADNKTQITYVNPAFSKITGYTSKEVIGNKTELLHSSKHDKKFYQEIWDKVNKNGHWQGEIWERRKGKGNFPVLQTINTIKNKNEEIYYVSIFKDMSNLKEKENELWKLAHFDQLTNLANRKLLEERINSALSEAYRHKRIGSIIFLDLDNFKHINDSLGHAHGDLLLKEISARLESVTRSEDTVARLGGDEYVILLPDLADSAEEATILTTAIITKMVQALLAPCSIEGSELHITTSMGVVLFPSDGNSSQKLLKQADTAMYAAKDDGKNTFNFYHSNMQEMADKRLLLENELRRALKKNELVVYYQPQYNQYFELIGFEALVRWIHPERGLISPDDFIPVAEESDLILKIGDKVFSDACNLLVMAEKKGQAIPQISINISPRQFSDLNFIDWINSIMHETEVNPKQLILELTEGIIVKNLEQTISNMQILKNSGIRFSIDDFGTGYSSLAYLKQLPIDELKIDRSFICDIGVTQNDTVIVDTIVSMARHLDLELIAEGVETKEQFDYLVKCGCNGFQGFYFGHPVPADQINTENQYA
ncbi:MAG: EAL domain-containing protein [Methylococcales bacterium]|nr:EAL domain-containing protein [Methylococcales bacterium]